MRIKPIKFPFDVIAVFIFLIILFMSGVEIAQAGIRSSIDEPKTRIYSGNVSSTGTCTGCPTGWSATNSGGLSTITHNLNLTATSDLDCVSVVAAFNPMLSIVYSQAVNNFGVAQFVSATSALQSTDFNFMCHHKY